MNKRIRILLSIMIAGVIALSAVHLGRAAESPTAAKDSVAKIAGDFNYTRIEDKARGDAAPAATAEKGATEDHLSVIKNADKLSADLSLTRERNRFIAIGLLLVSLILSLYCVLYYIRKTNCSADDIVHASGLVLIIFGTIIIVLMIDVEAQLTAAIGVMGAIAGYLFGSMRRGKNGEATVPNPPHKQPVAMPPAAGQDASASQKSG